jgi:hypothetical protein
VERILSHTEHTRNEFHRMLSILRFQYVYFNIHENKVFFKFFLFTTIYSITMTDGDAII